MPAGVSWPKYMIFFTTAMLTMLAGAQTVHVYYNPMSDFDKYVKEELKRHTNEHRKKP